MYFSNLFISYNDKVKYPEISLFLGEYINYYIEFIIPAFKCKNFS